MAAHTLMLASCDSKAAMQPKPGPNLGHLKRTLVPTVLHLKTSADLGHFESHTVFLSQLLQLRKDAVSQAGGALCVQAVHHALHQVDLQGKRELCGACTELWTSRAAQVQVLKSIFRLPLRASWAA